MTLASTLVMSVATLLFERDRWTRAAARHLGRDRLQRDPDLRLRPGDLADHGAQPAADRLEHVGDDDPGARRRLRRVVAERAAALAGRGGDRPGAGGDRHGDAAGARRALSRSSRRRDRRSRARRRSRFRAPPSPSPPSAARGRSPAHAGRRAPAGGRSAPRAAMPCSPASRATTGAHSTRSATHRRRALVVEGQHVGRVVLAAVLAVERAAFLGADDAHRELGRRGQRRAQPAGDAMARQQRPVGRVGELQRQAERRAWQRRRRAQRRSSSRALSARP